MSSVRQFNRAYIVKEGYLTKSPPLDEVRLIPRRWRLRWFVLYDDGVDDVALYYFNSEQQVVQGRPKGRIPLIGAEVYKQRGRLHGYSHVINVQSEDRLYHLCSTQEPIHEDWLEKIRDHHTPNTEVMRRNSDFSCPRLSDPRPSVTSDNTLNATTFERHYSNASNSSALSNSDDDIEYASSRTFFLSSTSDALSATTKTATSKRSSLPSGCVPTDENIRSLSRNFDATLLRGLDEVDRRVNESIKSGSRPLLPPRNPMLASSFDDDRNSNQLPQSSIPSVPPRSDKMTTMRTTDGDDGVTGDGDLYITMTGEFKLKTDSDDEGYGRSSSDASNASSSTSTSSASNFVTPSDILMTAVWNSRNQFQLKGIFGPSLLPKKSTKTGSQLPKAKSIGDITSLYNTSSSGHDDVTRRSMSPGPMRRNERVEFGSDF